MSEFKFNCPTCGQRILAATDWKGRSIDCPSCQAKITIPAPPKAPKKIASNTRPIPTTTAKPVVPPIAPPAKVSPPAPVVKVAPSPSRPPADSSRSLQRDQPQPAEPAAKPKPISIAPAAPPTGQLRIAVLTPAIKLEMVRSVRERIAQESNWLPGKIKGALAYAAKVIDGKNVLVEEKSPEATRFSLVGAFLLELHRRQVTRTATGRTRLLDQEIPDAVREVLHDEMSEEDRDKAEVPLADVDIASISHAQCLAALEVLEERYSQKMEQARVEKAKKSLGNVRLADLVKKLEIKARIPSEDVATALYHELMDLRRRLDKLESRNPKEK